MGVSQSGQHYEAPSRKHTATLYYFAGRGMADQIRWMLAAAEVDFAQKTVSTREQFLKMAERQLPFGQLPLLQIDEMEIVQSQVAVRYLAKRAHLLGSNSEEAVKCDMIAESVRDVLPLLLSAPFKKFSSSNLKLSTTDKGKSSSDSSVNEEEWSVHLNTIKDKWSFIGGRLEAIIQSNMPSAIQLNKKNPASPPIVHANVFMVGRSLTYADILVAHLVTWMVEECGTDIVKDMPMLVALQNQVISLPSIREFIKSINYFPLGDATYVEQVIAANYFHLKLNLLQNAYSR